MSARSPLRPNALTRFSPFPTARARGLCWLSAVFPGGPALADGAPSADLPGVSTGALLQTLLGLGAVLGMLLLAVFLLRKLNDGRGFGNRGPLRMVGGLTLGTRERIVVVEAGDTWLVLGVAPGQISTLHTMPKAEVSPGIGQEKPFGQWLRQTIDGKHDAK